MKVRTSMGLTRGALPVGLLRLPVWVSLSPTAQAMYLRAWIDESATHIGTRRWSIRRWTRTFADLDEDTALLGTEELASAGFITVDPDEEIAHLRGWLPRDGVTRGPKMGLPVATAFERIDSEPIRRSVLSDLTKSRVIDREDWRNGYSSRAANRAKITGPSPDVAGFWTHAYMAPIVAQMPPEDEVEDTPLDGLLLPRTAPVGLGRGGGATAFATLPVLEAWALLTLYLRASGAGVVDGPVARMLCNRATGEDMTERMMRSVLGSLRAAGWIEESPSEPEYRVRFFHAHDESPKYHYRADRVKVEIDQIACDRLRESAWSEIALSLTLGLAVPKSETASSFWRALGAERVQWPASREYRADDLLAHGIGPSLPSWPSDGRGAPDGWFGWVPRPTIVDSPESVPETRLLAAMSPTPRQGMSQGMSQGMRKGIGQGVDPDNGDHSTKMDTLANTLTNTLTHTPADTLTSPAHDGPYSPSQRRDSAPPTPSVDTLADTLTDTLAGTLLDPESRIQSPESRVRPARDDAPGNPGTDGRTPPPSPIPDDLLAFARDWVKGLSKRPGPLAVKVRRVDAAAAAVAARLHRGESLVDLEAAVGETLSRDGVRDRGAYLLTLLEDLDRWLSEPSPSHPPRGPSKAPRGSASAGATTTAPGRRRDPFADGGAR